MGFSALLSGVSRLFGKEEVGGSNPLGSSKKKTSNGCLFSVIFAYSK